MLRLQEKIENVVSDAGMDQEQQNHNCGYRSTARSSLVVFVFAEPKQSAWGCDYEWKTHVGQEININFAEYLQS